MNNQIQPPKAPEPPATRYIRDPEFPDWLFWIIAACFAVIVFMPVINRLL